MASSMPFTRKAIAKAFFDLDISDGELSTPVITSKANHHASLSPITNKIQDHDRITLLTLPAELRLRIYNYLLVSRFDRMENPSWAVGDTDQKLISLHMIRAPQYRTMEPAILRTCKQIYSEGNSILYSQNVFAVSEPKQMFQLNVQIGLANLQLIRTLQIWVPWMAKLAPYLQLLHMLSRQASGLRHLQLAWGAQTEFPWHFDKGARERGLGDSLDFVRALRQIQGLDKLVIKGYYAKNWPAYLREGMDAQVLAICGDCREERELGEVGLDDEELENAKFIRKLNKREMEAFTRYQQGTENLNP